MRKWIVYKADTNQPHWRGRKLQHTQALTKILQENWDSSDSPIPKVGDRFTEYVRVSEEHDPRSHGYSTHYKQGDWEVVRVETYATELQSSSCGMLKNHKLASAIADCGFYEFKRQLTYKCEWLGSELVIADRFVRLGWPK
ncbi:hypothetical protein [Okeania sp. SIO3B5]|uniref:hypothetical protein n=1 Tax=Okeania sp. SIO3B5 TaxID=2607811 RepID=UPI0035C938B3